MTKINVEDEMTLKMRTNSAIAKKQSELENKVWYYRKLVMFTLIRAGKEQMFDESLAETMTKNMRRIEKEHGVNEDWRMTDNEWGYLQGKFAALNWVLGFEDDFIDT